jgi:hypothetical protein
MSLKKSLQGITKFSDLIEFVGRDLEYENLSDQIKDKDFWNGVGSSKELLSDGREVVRITQIPEDGKEFSDIKRHLRNTGPEGRELLNIIVYTDDESKITGEVHFMYHARNPRGEKGIEYDLKYFSVNPKDVSPVYYEYLKEIKVNGRSITDLENEESDDSLLDTFSVDKITNSFYDDFHNLIQNKLEPSITDLPENVSKRHYSQLLTNRILFILFIQEKEWLSIENDSNQGQTDYLEQKYVEVKEQEDVDLWKDFFKELFFNGLSKKGSSPDIVGTVPYLNGGLFEKRDYEDEVNVDSEFFEALLSPEEVNSFGKKKGFLRNYKISLSESNPSEQELVVDPEFIGRVFEMSMQDTEERGEKGAFYTPKDITQYMSKNSIKQLLLNELPEKEEEISQLVLSHEIKENFTEEELQTIHDELKDINVLDPAVGSGAFIIAVMEELVGIFEAINPEIGEEEDTYDLKEHMIANNLYGVDIDQAGIELCKFRTWLHLMQDLEVDLETLKKQNDKYALPNLDFKFFVGNSLSGDYKPIEAINEIKTSGYQKRLDADQDESNLINKIEEKRRKFTETHDQEEKKELETEIKDLTDRLENSIDWVKTDYYMEEVVRSSGDDFKWSVHMPEVIAEGGFDIIIANPPYLGGSGSPDYVNQLGRFYSQKMDEYKRIPGMQYDLYQKFILRGNELLKKKGILNYITSRTFLTLESKETTRNILLKNDLDSLVVANTNTFDAAVKPAIFSFRKENSDRNFLYIDARETEISSYASLTKFDRSSSKDVEHLERKDCPMYSVDKSLYNQTFHNVLFLPNPMNLELSREVMEDISRIAEDWENTLRNTRSINSKLNEIKNHAKNLSEGDVSMFGMLVSGGRGLDTGNNNEFLAYVDGTDEAEEIKEKFSNTFQYGNKLADKEELKRGQLSTVITKDMIAEPQELTNDEKINGIKDKEKCWVPIEKGFSSSDVFYKEANEYIKWSSDSLERLAESGNIRNPSINFKEGLYFVLGGHANLRTRYSNNRVIENGNLFTPFDDTLVSSKYLSGLINSDICQYIFETFINKSGVSTTYVRFLPIRIPEDKEKQKMEELVEKAIEIQKGESEEDLEKIKEAINKLAEEIYGVELDE